MQTFCKAIVNLWSWKTIEADFMYSMLESRLFQYLQPVWHIFDHFTVCSQCCPMANYRHQSKMSSFKKIDLYRNFAAGVYLSAAPSFLGFWLRWCIAILLVLNLVRYRVLHFCRIWYPIPPLHTVYVYTVYLVTQRRGGGRVEPERRLEGQ